MKKVREAASLMAKPQNAIELFDKFKNAVIC